ncbi:MAG: 16S rRNA (cytosine(1402)-N(4))-methyltransferase RsmH [Luteolibacter sp.]
MDIIHDSPAINSLRDADGPSLLGRVVTTAGKILRISGKGTAREFVRKTDVRAASGWLPARRPLLISQKQAEGSAETAGIQSGSASKSQGAPQAQSGEPGTSTPSYHQAVLPREVLEWMNPAAGQWIIDGTLGGGGHSRLFLQAGAEVLGIDQDPEAIAHAKSVLGEFGNRFQSWQGNFAQLMELPQIRAGQRADGILLDIGVSSHQLDSPHRGFSFMREGPLDMRMGPGSAHSAAEIVNEWPESDLVRIFYEFGEEPKARRIAAAIVKQREQSRFTTTTQLAACIESSVGRQGRIHPATRVFQAIRIAANRELESLETALEAATHAIQPGGRLLVITFHSLEDRIVKRFLRKRSARFIDDPSWPEPRENPDYQFELPTRKAIVATAAETTANPRARSAKLRVAQLVKPSS